MSAPSPTPSNMPPPNLKRPRPSGATAASGSTNAPQGSGSRTKRRKPDTSVGGGADESIKGKGEDEMGDSGEVKTKIDFNELPVETLYKYLEYHDLLPRWDVSPWSEDPCTPPNQLYTLSSSAPIVPPPTTTIQPAPQEQPQDQTSQLPQSQLPPPTDTQIQPPSNGAIPVNGQSGHVDEPQLPQLPPTVPEQNPTTSIPSDQPETIQPKAEIENGTQNGESAPPPNGPEENGNGDDNPEDGETPLDNFEPPTTRSKTLPTRQPNTNTPSPEPLPQIKRGVITLSDVYAAREVLAEKANNHWMKGLGGGQNKEGETIVNFLYKMKVGQGRLLRVYNPTPANYSW
ncbi:hypothetical protein I302_107708 [Kwoniella bestiolae CBS 10118]|uniref:Uncharacterized protein n=1 Tax=Kwoniella bestiolae CBS 10118 TaxID=1296100 RepID=A0AAJ8KDR3_9TREE